MFERAHALSYCRVGLVMVIAWSVGLEVRRADAQVKEVGLFSGEFRIMDLSQAMINYNVGSMLEEYESNGASSFLLELVRSPQLFGQGANAYPIETACCSTEDRTKSVKSIMPTSAQATHVNGQTVYHVRARARITNDIGEPIYTPLYDLPSISMSHVEYHQRGDYNYDGVVDAADYTVWRDTFGTNQLPADGDGLNGVDQGDYSVWKTRYGQSLAASPAASFAAPEPAAVAGFLTAALAGSVLRSRRQARNPVASCL